MEPAIDAKAMEVSKALEQHEAMQSNFEQVLREPPNPPPYPAAAGQYTITAPPSAVPYGVQQPPVVTSQVNVTVGQQQLPVVVHTEPMPDNTSAIMLSCFVFLCCCWPLGLAAFILAVMADGTRRNASDVRNMIRIANVLSAIGVVCGIILISVVIAVNSH